VISESYAEANDLAPGQKFRIVIDQTSLWLQVQAVTRYFPTLNPDDAPFIVTPYALTLYALQRRPTAQVYDNERWISVDGSAAGWRDALDAGLQGGLTGALDRETLRAGMQTDLLTTGLVGLLLLAFVIGVVLSIISLMTYTALNVRARRRNLVTLRALGWPLWRMAVGLTLEQAFVILLATGLGASVGALLSAQVLPALSISATGSALVPPYRVTFDPALFAVYCALIVIVFVAQSGFAALLVNRLARETVKAAGGDV
jgi:hypothetical protein